MADPNETRIRLYDAANVEQARQCYISGDVFDLPLAQVRGQIIELVPAPPGETCLAIATIRTWNERPLNG